MKKYKINIQPAAIEDIINIRKNITEKYNDVFSAEKVVNRIFDKIEALTTLPKSAETRLIVSELELRFLKISKYTVVYYVDDTESIVKVYGVFHSRRDFSKIITNRT